MVRRRRNARRGAAARARLRATRTRRSRSPRAPPTRSPRCPEAVNFRVKPVIGATYQTLKEKLTGLGKDIQASDMSDLDYEAVKKALA